MPGKDRRTIYWKNRKEKKTEEPISWRGHGGSYSLHEYDPQTGTGVVMSDIGPQAVDLRDMNTADAAKRATIANYAAAEKYPTADPNSKISDLHREVTDWRMQSESLFDQAALAEMNRGPRTRPEQGMINGIPESTYMANYRGPNTVNAPVKMAGADNAAPAPQPTSPMNTLDYYDIGGETSGEPSWTERVYKAWQKFRNRPRDTNADRFIYGDR